MLLTTLFSHLTRPQTWSLSVWIVASAVIAAFLTSRLASRPVWPSRAPKPVKGWPFVGSPGFFRQRWTFLRLGSINALGGHFSFFYASYPVVALSGDQGRRTLFMSRSLFPNPGYCALALGAPDLDHLDFGHGTVGDIAPALMKRCSRRDVLATRLHYLVNDCKAAYRAIDVNRPVDVAGSMNRLVYQLTHRVVGVNDMASDEKLLQKTFRIVPGINRSSGLEVLFPSWPIPSRLGKLWACIRVYRIMAKIVDNRRRLGLTDDDTLQWMMDSGYTNPAMTFFILSGIFAGLSNTSVNAGWIVVLLSKNEEWHRKVRDEVDASIDKHRIAPDETRVDILSRLTVDDWEVDFPLIGLCLRETIRLVSPGSVVRRNMASTDVSIGGSNQVIPGKAFAVYPLADIHLNPDIYSDPYAFDPGRYLAGRAEDQKTDLGYIGWGAGLHPCMGIKIAKLQITISTAMLFAFFDFDAVDKQGNLDKSPLPAFNQNLLEAESVPGRCWVKCRLRSQAV